MGEEAGGEGDGVVGCHSGCVGVGFGEPGPSVDISGEVGGAPVAESDGVTFGVGSSCVDCGIWVSGEAAFHDVIFEVSRRL